MLTQQETYEKIATHLFTQGKQSSNDEGVCLYRDGKGNSCAIGCMIPDRLYESSLELQTLTSLIESPFDAAVELKSGVPELRAYTSMLVLLQDAHDNYDNWDDLSLLMEHIRSIGLQFDLNVDFLAQFER